MPFSRLEKIKLSLAYDVFLNHAPVQSYCEISIVNYYSFVSVCVPV